MLRWKLYIKKCEECEGQGIFYSNVISPEIWKCKNCKGIGYKEFSYDENRKETENHVE